ncbi:hypothetical protein AKG11_23655 [Shinella sp. SUS2]|jgi:hypothetical protein|uniref:hypothetical protein n=1 Tax=unclassified Shinella TaxID=2643062 RepID=UPI0003C5390E|nr:MULTISPECIES: hypothetical protein [unclassified Shinella]MCA0342957.1 hypothetical protein [Pseudomonadota bacterium]EYR82503.1 hypothetical protein SHLA_29c000090 [Shinella sp. DD12]KNY14511.1 hypothetical protein AKG11_23655 [Shinella sp. SUS2]KOC74164.1 hypothetical protein AKG10_18515 [Shinella sp. GWS1]MCA0424773.1 hypothetical protein [Pseudomonadota bacterium]
MADRVLRHDGRRPHLLYLRSTRSYNRDRIGGLVPQDWRYSAADVYDLETIDLAEVDVVMLSGMADQIFLKSIEAKLVDYLAGGGHFLLNGHILLPFLPCLSPFRAVPPKPFTNWMIRPAQPGAYFGRMDFENFHRHEGILGQYARGFSDAPAGAQWLCLIGGPGPDGTVLEGPVDWVWRMPGGGKVFMHNGDHIEQFCSDPRQQPNLFHDILNALVFSDEPPAAPAEGRP